MKKGLAIILLLAMLTACTQGENTALVINDNVITVEAFLSEYDYLSKALSEDEKGSNFLDKVIETVVFDTIIEMDLRDHMNSVTDEEVKEYEDNLISKLGSKEDLKRSIESFGISEEGFNKSIKKSIQQIKHYKSYESSINLDMGKVEKYFNKNKEDIYLYRIADIIVQSKAEAEGVVKELDDGTSVDDIIKRYNEDLFETTSGKITGLIDSSSDEFIDDGIKNLDVDGKYTKKINGNYHIIMVLEKISDFDDLLDNTKDRYIKGEYIKYLNDLSKKYDVKVFKSNIEKKINEESLKISEKTS